MPDDAANAPPPALARPDWLEESTERAMQQAAYRTQAFGRSAHEIAEAVREIARAHMPAAPMPAVEQAVAWIVPDPQGPASHAPLHNGEPLRVAMREEVAETLAYALRFDTTGKPRRTGHDLTVHLAAMQLVKQLELSGYVLMKRPPNKPHTAGANR